VRPPPEPSHPESGLPVMETVPPKFPTDADWERAGHPGGCPLVLIDGECVLCHGAARFILRWEKQPTCLFAALDSDFARAKLTALGHPSPDGSSVMVLWQGDLRQRSEAVLLLARGLRWPWSTLRWGKGLPRAARDALYDFVAARRLRWFGSTQYCQPIAAEERSRFAPEEN
jgi:predicted DCC family thiol-disulfide oxidoreductase YuxK